jgi:hypothetical protein
LLLVAPVIAPPLAAQTPAPKRWPVVPVPYVEGYAATIAGQRFTYRTADPLITSSLLVRSVDSTRYIEWRSAPIPDAARGSMVTIQWMASMDVVDPGSTQHHFVLSLNGRPWFSIPQPPAATPADWHLDGPDGSRLSFHTLLVDWAGDVNGLMTMRVPLADFPGGTALTMRVTGESAGSQAWYMTFTQPVAPMAQISAEQALVRTRDGIRQALRVGIWSLADSTSLRVEVDGSTRLRGTVSRGWNVFHVPIPEVTRPIESQVTLASDWDSVRWTHLPLVPVVPRTVYLIPHAHLDIGYNVLQKEAEFRHLSSYDEGMALARKTAAYPPDARFHWNIEGNWPVEDYLSLANAPERAAFLAAARRGDLSLNAFYANLMTGLSRPEELEWAVHYATLLRAKYGVPITTAMTSDVPGFTWGVVPVLANAGIRYLSSGPNYQSTLPGRGDRIGNLLKTWGDSAFYWMSPSGTDSVLVMVAGRGYSWFHGRRRGWPGLADDAGLIDYMDSLSTEHYPWSIVQVRYTTGDNGGVDTLLPDAVRRWDRTYVSPRVIIATLPMMFTAFERAYGPRLQRVRGDWTGYWEDGAGSTARETGESRMAAERLTQAGILWSMLQPRAYPADSFWQAWRDVVLFSEHTWGADRSISDPDEPFVLEQWAVKRGFADSADARSRALLAAATGPVGGTDTATVTVYNTSSWTRSGPVTLGTTTFFADSVPPLGARQFPRSAMSPSPAAHAAGDSLWNGIVVARVDTVTGALRSFRWKGHELVDTARGGWDAYEYVPGRSSTAAVGVRGVATQVSDSGPLIAALTVRSSAPGARALTRTYRIAAGSDVIEFATTVDKLPIRTKEGVHLGFAFNVPGGQVRLDEPWAIVRPDSDQLAGADRNVFSVGRWADVSNDSIGVTWATLDAPLLEVGGMWAEDWHHDDGTEAWLTHLPPTQLLYSYVMNNYWHTNFKADQSGPVTFRYAVRPHGAWDPGAAERFGMEESQPLIAVPGAAPRPTTPITSDDPDVIISSLRPDGDALVARLFDPTPTTRRVGLRWASMSTDATVPAFGAVEARIGPRPPLLRRPAPVR